MVKQQYYNLFKITIMNKRKIYYLLLLIILVACNTGKQQQSEDKSNVFIIDNPNYEISPYTGVTRDHWKDAAVYLLEGAFGYIKNLEDPMRFPKQHAKTYPQDGSYSVTENLEGLSRTLFIAAPLLKENPDLEINGIKVLEYYHTQFKELLNPDSKMFLPKRHPNGGPSQILVELGAVAISLSAAPEVLWHPMEKEVKDSLAELMLSYGDGPTIPSNWRFFNIFIQSFLKDLGYEVDEALMVEYLKKSLEQYRGEGWYNDSPAYDFYSMWAFQMYGKMWAQFFGEKYYPEIAAEFNSNFSDLQYSYSNIFDANGEMIMWGRSIAYRFASAIPFPLMGWDNDENINYGWARRISSATLIQFLTHPEFLEDNVPTLGFYGAYEPATQIYSCRGSVYWMGKLFFGLLLPEDNPFWAATENNGQWEDGTIEKNSVKNIFHPSIDLLITNYSNIGATEVRAWCHERVANDWQKFRSSENYNRLSYNTAFHWQADGDDGEVAMNYMFKNDNSKWECFRLYNFKKFENGVFKRDVILETSDNYSMKLSDIPLANGVLRVDKQTSSKDVEMRLGHYALPDIGNGIKESTKKVGKYSATILDNSEYQLALIPLVGWQNSEVVSTKGLSPIAEESKILTVMADYETDSNSIYSVLMLWKESGKKWSKKELMPIKEINISSDENSVEVIYRNNSKSSIQF